MRRFLFSILFFSLLAGCSVVQKIGPHRIDVQQGNALDPESVARLKPGLNRSQVRFLLGTPLVVDPFHGDRWDYVYVFYEAGRLVEQKRITLFFDGDVLARIEGDVPAAGLADQPSETTAPAVEDKPVSVSEPVPSAPVPSPVKQAPESPSTATPSSIVQPLPSPKNAPEYVDPRLLVEPELSPNDGAAVLPESQP
ncbi:MAG: outer membrane protein assembly factor BamE [Thiobacillus sp.]|nr:outer membrane protein assembly factor BamE [Thiobacillus sp.]MDP3126297.1 outer membrane protein assembly factor BamE [Thiobacillus sp.]